MRILALDTTESRLSLAFDDGTRVLGVDRFFLKPHDETLFPKVGALLARGGLDLRAIEGIAASSGPGRFTGIRVGLTFAAVLGRVLEAPVAALTKFEALAWRLSRGPRPGKASHAFAVFSAQVVLHSRSPGGAQTRRRDAAQDSEYYLQELRLGEKEIKTEGAAFWVNAEDGLDGLRDRLRSRVFCGPAARSLADLLGLDFWGGPASLREVGAADLLGPARERLSKGGSVPRPLYLKPARFEKPK